MLDSRLYRAAFVPLLLGILLAAFALSDQPRPIGTTLAPDAFDGRAAFGILTDLERTFPNRRPGSAGDEALATRLETELSDGGFSTRRVSEQAETIDGEETFSTVIGERTGRNPRRLLVIAQRDASEPGSVAQLSGTATLVALARLFRGRSVRRTLTLVSTSGGTGGAAGVRRLVAKLGGPTDAAIVIGDVAGDTARTPRVLAWSEHGGIAPMRLRRTVENAVRQETGLAPSTPRALLQLARLAVPLTLTPQGALGADGVSAVTLQASGERGPGADDDVSMDRLEDFGRATLRSITALDNGPDVPGGPREYLVFQRRVLAKWAVTMLAALLLLPAVVGAVDGFARVRRRRRPVAAWFPWLALLAAPFLVTALVARLLGLSGAAPDLHGVVGAGAVPIGWGVIAGLAVALAAGFAARRWFPVRGPSAQEDCEGAAAALSVVLVLLAVGILVINPYTALLLAVTVHCWLLAVVPEVRLHRLRGVLLVLAGFAPWVLVALSYANAFRLDAAEALWSGVLLLTGGTAGPLGVLVWSVLLACGIGAAAIAWRKRPAPRPEEEPPGPLTTRGPAGYAGPGSLGGTESALRR